MIIFYILLTLIILSILSHMIRGRSLIATIVAIGARLLPLSIKFKEDEKGTFERVSKFPKKEYQFPKFLKLKSSIKETRAYNMKVFVLNEESESNYVIFYIHGGGFAKEISFFHWLFLDKIAVKTKAKIIVPLYPLIPHHSYKDTYPQIIQMYKDILKNNPDRKIIIMGDSAGGNIGAAICENLSKKNQPDELILLSPAPDMQPDLNDPKEVSSFKKCTLVGIEGIRVLGRMRAGDKENLTNPLVSPIYGDVSKLNKVSIFLGQRDMAYSMGLKFAQKLEKEGIDVQTIIGKGMNHVWPIQPVPEAIKARKQICEIIER